ncbi:MAG: hypothetical protein ACK498_09610 [Cyclobacteriaceae bacterium]|jgi:hypothetical protein
MARGGDVITQANLGSESWVGRADFLIKIAGGNSAKPDQFLPRKMTTFTYLESIDYDYCKAAKKRGHRGRNLQGDRPRLRKRTTEEKQPLWASAKKYLTTDKKCPSYEI